MLKRFKYKTSTPPDLKQYIGKTVRIGDTIVRIETICGNAVTPAFYEVNGEHLIGILRFHAQMTGAKDITEEQFKAFEEIEFFVEKVPTKKTVDLKVKKDVKDEDPKNRTQ